ncbi:uncharacterized protein [Nothobranchius furzeri]|uniref:LOC107391609-like protein n=1 Tax=Nothobranchius furzeri TaxID=105023 RepID=A0A9D3BXJ5_NOTFU|nr:uncharacterized protein LOC107391609 isoform X1 [Nothobranchius furzeri]KAF7223855.1 putative LOC107391609-like protein [Nothobranchius furzeri]
MERSKLRSKSKLKEAAVRFFLGTVGGCILGATEDPVDSILSVMTESGLIQPVMEEIRAMGAIGLGSLMGATALTTAMTSVIAGVISAAVAASVFVSMRSCRVSYKKSVGLWASAGLAGALGTTLSGVTFGTTIEWIVKSYGMLGLMWILALFTVLKPPLHFLFQVIWRERQICCSLGSDIRSREREDIEGTEWQLRQRVTVQIEQRIVSIEKGGSTNVADDQTRWVAEQKEREEIERKKMDNEEAELEQRTIQDWINVVVVKYVDFLAFSGIPMAVVAIVTSIFGLFGLGTHQSVVIVLLVSVSGITYFLLKSSDFKFWMMVGCMGMFATFIIAMLTQHARQEVLTAAVKMGTGGHVQSRDLVSTEMDLRSSLEAVSTAFFAAKLCQLGLGATVGGVLVRRADGGVKVIIGAASVAGGLLAGMQALAVVLSDVGAGALLAVVGAAGVSVGATAVSASRSSWPGAVGTMGGLIIGALGMGKWHVVNIGLQLPAALVFAMNNPF